MLFQNFPPSIRCPFESTRFCWHHQNHVRLPCTRLETLWRQQAWVATDEMNYYLTATQVHNRANPFPTIMFLHEADASEMAMEWLAIALSPLLMTQRRGAQLPSSQVIGCRLLSSMRPISFNSTRHQKGHASCNQHHRSCMTRTKLLKSPRHCCLRLSQLIADSRRWNGS